MFLTNNILSMVELDFLLYVFYITFILFYVTLICRGFSTRASDSEDRAITSYVFDLKYYYYKYDKY